MDHVSIPDSTGVLVRPAVTYISQDLGRPVELQEWRCGNERLTIASNTTQRISWLMIDQRDIPFSY